MMHLPGSAFVAALVMVSAGNVHMSAPGVAGVQNPPAAPLSAPVMMTVVGALPPAGAQGPGPVVLSANVDASGFVTTAAVLRGDPALSDTAISAVRQWTFSPQSEPFDTTVMINVHPSGGGVFRLASAPGSPWSGADPSRDAAASGSETRALRVGGSIKPPAKLADAKPVYPKDAQDAKIQGVVIVEAMIGPDGTVLFGRALRPVTGVTEAALEAVGNWVFSPTLLNGNPIPVLMTVTVNFTLQ